MIHNPESILFRELTLLYYKQSLDLVNRLALETNTYLIWSRKYLPPYFNTAYEVDFEGDKISIVGKVSILPGNLEDIMEIDGYFDKQYYNPFDVLIVDFNTKANCIGIEGPLQMPVFMFKWMMDNIYKADAKLGIDIAVTTASFVIGVGAVKTAVQAGSKAWKVALAISAAAHAGSKVYFKLDDEVAEKLINSGESGERFLKVWKGMDKVFDGVTITESIVNQSFPLLFAFSKSFDTLSKDLGKDNLKEILGDETYEMFIKLHTVINTELLAL